MEVYSVLMAYSNPGDSYVVGVYASKQAALDHLQRLFDDCVDSEDVDDDDRVSRNPLWWTYYTDDESYAAEVRVHEINFTGYVPSNE